MTNSIIFCGFLSFCLFSKSYGVKIDVILVYYNTWLSFIYFIFIWITILWGKWSAFTILNGRFKHFRYMSVSVNAFSHLYWVVRLPWLNHDTFSHKKNSTISKRDHNEPKNHCQIMKWKWNRIENSQRITEKSVHDTLWEYKEPKMKIGMPSLCVAQKKLIKMQNNINCGRIPHAKLLIFFFLYDKKQKWERFK